MRSGHPWIFADSIREQNREGEAGELAAVFDRDDTFLAVGLSILFRRFDCEFCTPANQRKSTSNGSLKSSVKR